MSYHTGGRIIGGLIALVTLVLIMGVALGWSDVTCC